MAFLELYPRFKGMDEDDFAILEFSQEECYKLGFLKKGFTFPAAYNESAIEAYKTKVSNMTEDEYYANL